MRCPVRELTEKLIRRPSLTPDDAGCLDLIGDRLDALGFQMERLDRNGVSNLWATYGTVGPMICFAGHTDVVPAGDLGRWSSDPFEPTEFQGGMLRGRGAADMKTSLAAMIVACESFLANNSNPKCRLGFLLTSDEEGVATDGTIAVVETLISRQQNSDRSEIDYCIVGEPSSMHQLGDVVRIGRRGSINAEIAVEGVQGHVAYPELVHNPIHATSRLIARLTAINWDEEINEEFPPTSFQVSNINAGSGVANIVPQSCEFSCNWRFSTSTSNKKIRDKVEELLDKLEIKAKIRWFLSGEPFITQRGRLTKVVSNVIKKNTGITPVFSTGGGTSDGRFISTLGCEIVELGPVNRTIHKVNEEVDISDLPRLKTLYQDIIEALIG